VGFAHSKILGKKVRLTDLSRSQQRVAKANASGPSEPSWIRVDDGAHDGTIEENWLFRLRKERFQSRLTGKTHDFYVMHLADAVHAVALTRDDRMILVRQFRAGSGRDSLEIPGGLLEPGEDPCTAGARELLEETGYAGDPPEFLGALWSNPSLVTSRTNTIVIRNARHVTKPNLDHSEELAVELVPIGNIPQLIQEGRIDHALVVAGLLWWLSTAGSGMMGTPLSRD
jgi:8-oxo-dGTP pyrophosphatase MutT (NUDIX family)